MQIPADRIDRVREQWAAERPDVDTSSMDVIGRILRVEHLADSRIRRTLREAGLDRGGFDVLATLHRSGRPYRLSPTRLYEELVLTSGAVTHRVDALLRAGLVERIADDSDRRSLLVGLTVKGRSVIDGALVAHLRCEQELLAGLSARERDQLSGLLRKLLHGIEGPHE
jgi:DNA-binding MarR family transcriptional regulator